MNYVDRIVFVPLRKEALSYSSKLLRFIFKVSKIDISGFVIFASVAFVLKSHTFAIWNFWGH